MNSVLHCNKMFFLGRLLYKFKRRSVVSVLTQLFFQKSWEPPLHFSRCLTLFSLFAQPLDRSPQLAIFAPLSIQAVGARDSPWYRRGGRCPCRSTCWGQCPRSLRTERLWLPARGCSGGCCSRLDRGTCGGGNERGRGEQQDQEGRESTGCTSENDGRSIVVSKNTVFFLYLIMVLLLSVSLKICIKFKATLERAQVVVHCTSQHF